MKLVVNASLGKAQLQKRLAESVGDQAIWVDEPDAAIGRFAQADALICPDHFIPQGRRDAAHGGAPEPAMDPAHHRRLRPHQDVTACRRTSRSATPARPMRRRSRPMRSRSCWRCSGAFPTLSPDRRGTSGTATSPASSPCRHRHGRRHRLRSDRPRDRPPAAGVRRAGRGGDAARRARRAGRRGAAGGRICRRPAARRRHRDRGAPTTSRPII